MQGFSNSRLVRELARRAPMARAFAALAAAAVFTASCDVHGISEPGSLRSITISPNPQTIGAAQTIQYVAVGRDHAGEVVTFTPTWSIAAGGGAITSDAGLFTAGTVPNTFANTITVTSGGISATATVTVVPGPLANITVTPVPVTLMIGTTQQFVAVGTDAFGNVVPIAPNWSIVNGGGAVTSAGMFTAGMVSGTYANTVQASSGLIMGTATVTETAGPLASIVVTPTPATLAVGGAQTFTAAGQDASGNAVAITPVWSIAASGGTITAAGVFTAGTTPGTFTGTARATSGTINGAATVIVTAGPLASITVTPNPHSMVVGGTQQFTAVGRDASSNVVVFTPTWSVINGGGTISATGLFTAGATAGTYTNTVQASSGLVTGTATVTETASTLATITVTPNPASVAANGTQQFTAVGRDAGGNTVAITPTWSVVNSGGAVSATGLFTAGNVPGTYANTVRAASGATSGTATVTVTAGVLTSITITPNPSTMAIGVTQQFTAVGRDADGNVVSFTPTWAVVAGGGTIGLSSGLWTAGNAPGTFTNTVRASSGTIAGFQTVTVTTGPLASITVTPNPVTVQANTTQQFTAVGRDAGGNVLGITPVWSTNSGGTINGSGLFTAGGTAGAFPDAVQASVGATNGKATVTVSAGAPVLTTIVVTPNPATVGAGNTRQFSASGLDQNGNPIGFTPVWSVVNGGGIINSSGLFTAGSVAGTFNNTVQAASGAVSGTATVTVTSNPTPPPLVDLGTAALNGIMAGTEVTCVALGVINANVSISPGATPPSGFPPCTITGVTRLHPDAIAIQNQIDLTAAYNQLQGMPCPPANFISANLGGTTKLPGVYCSATSIGVTGTLTLDGNGDPNANFVFQAGTSLITAGNVVLINGAQAKNVYWVVGSSATLGTASQFQGNIIALTSITLVDNATLLGRALARNGAVTLGTNNTITLPPQ
jgi:hypothetical protein